MSSRFRTNSIYVFRTNLKKKEKYKYINKFKFSKQTYEYKNNNARNVL